MSLESSELLHELSPPLVADPAEPINRADTVKWICPVCRSVLKVGDQSLGCPDCGKSFRLDSGIPSFSANSASHWQMAASNVSNSILEAAKRLGWQASLQMMDRGKAAWIRGDMRLAMPVFLANKGRVLDCGCGWGGLTFKLAMEYDLVFAFDALHDGLEFIRIRASQDGVRNIIPAQGDMTSLPYPDSYFDVVVMNGVLEWVGTCSDCMSPMALQRKALKEAARVLKPAGVLFLAIENRYGIQYFAGYREEHTSLRFISLLPRIMARVYHRLKKKSEFRALTHSRDALKALLSDQGLTQQSFFGAYPSYRKIRYLFSLDHPGSLRFVLHVLSPSSRSWQKTARWVLSLLADTSDRFIVWMSQYPPAFVVFASREELLGLALKLEDVPHPVMDCSEKLTLAVIANNRRAGIYCIDQQKGKLERKFTLPLNSSATQKMETTTLFPAILEKLSPGFGRFFANKVLFNTNHGMVSKIEGVSGRALRLSRRKDLSIFQGLISELCRVEIPEELVRGWKPLFHMLSELEDIIHKFGLNPALRDIVQKRQFVHCDLTLANIFIAGKAFDEIVLLDLEHAKVGPAVLNWYDFLIRNFIMQDEPFPIAISVIRKRYRKLAGKAWQKTFLGGLNRQILRACGVSGDLHPQLLFLYLAYLTRDPVFQEPAVLLNQLTKRLK